MGIFVLLTVLVDNIVENLARKCSNARQTGVLSVFLRMVRIKKINKIKAFKKTI